MRRLLQLILSFILVCTAPMYNAAAAQDNSDVKLYSLKPEHILSKLKFAMTKKASEKGDRHFALAALREYYRNRYPLPEVSSGDRQKDFKTADQIVNHVFQWGPYEPADYGDEIDWEWDPSGDIEWVAAIYRFYWALPLAEAYRATRDEKYAQAFVELASDWIAKHPLEKRDITHPVYTTWRGFPWLDIQTGIRATNLCRVFKSFMTI